MLTFAAGILIGYMGAQMQQYNHLHAATWDVIGDYGEGRYRVKCDVNSEGCPILICPHQTDPGFDVGDRMQVRYEEQSNPAGGICFSFQDEEKTSFTPIIDVRKKVVNAGLHGSD